MMMVFEMRELSFIAFDRVLPQPCTDIFGPY